jgi:hypothetical protein
MFASACTQSARPPGPTPTTTTPSSAGSPTPATRVGPGPAWDAVLGRIGPDGSVDAATALQAFSLAFGPLPGVAVPAGDPGTIPDATGPLEWLVGDWADIGPDQRTAAIRLVPMLATLGGTGSPSADVAAAAPVVLLKPVPTPRRSDSFYTDLAKTVAEKIGTKVGRSLGIDVKAHVDFGAGKFDAVTEPLNASGGTTGAIAQCVLTFGRSGDALEGVDLNALVFHEVWHCFQGTELGLDGFWNHRPAPWIIEGQANWVGNSLAPGADLDDNYWEAYLTAPETLLFKEAYSAMGFYAQLESSGTDVWHRLDPMLQASGNQPAFQAAGGTSDPLLNAWAAGFLRKPERGAAWDIVGANVTSEAASVPVSPVPNGGSLQASSPAYTNSLYGIPGASAADVLQFSFSGHARVSDASSHDYLITGEAMLCHRTEGCECPGQGPDQPPLLPVSGNVALAVTGDPGGDSGVVTGISLDDYCPKLTGTWNGTWRFGPHRGQSGTFVVTFLQKKTALTGSVSIAGGACITGGPIEGSVKGFTIEFGVVHSQHTIDYTGIWKNKALSGTFSTTSCDSPPIPFHGTWQATRK